MPSRRSAPLRTDELCLIKGEGVAVVRSPAQPGLGDSAFARLLGQVEVDVVEGFPVNVSLSAWSACLVGDLGQWDSCVAVLRGEFGHVGWMMMWLT